MIRSVLVISLTLLYILVVGTPYLIYTVLSGDTDRIYRAGVLGAKLAVRLAGVRVEARGEENIPARRAAIYMVNHQSNCDPPVVVGLLPPVLILIKEEFFRVPVLGRGMRLRGFIPVDRKRRGRSIHAIKHATESVKAGHSFLVFPEGTRSEDGRLLPFRKGVFVMAIESGAPIVPVSISGSRRIMPKGSFSMHSGVVRVIFHEAVETRGSSLDDLPEILCRVRQAILAGLAPEERPLGAAA
ncbi:MAG: lysophospholipid acyltransferase family protein [Terriglobia bacterium]